MSVSDWLPAAAGAAAVERKLPAGQTLFRQGNRTAGLYEIVRGKVRLVRVDASGREAILHTATAGDPSPRPRCSRPPITAMRLQPTLLVRLYPKAAVLAAFASNPKAAQAFMAMLARQVMSLRTRLEQRNIHSARDRVRHYLAINVGADGRTVALRGTIKDLAGELGLTQEALYRTLAAMAAAGEIKRDPGRISLTQPPYDPDHMVAACRRPIRGSKGPQTGNEVDDVVLVMEGQSRRRGDRGSNRLCARANAGRDEGMHGRMGQGGPQQMMPPRQGENTMPGAMTHGQQGMNGPMGQHQMMMGHPGGPARQATMAGQDAFGAIAEVVQILEADPATDWSKVDIGALREHLIDMNEVTLRAVAIQRALDNGVEITVTGEGRTRAAIKRMLPAHAQESASSAGRSRPRTCPMGCGSW